MIQAIGRYTLRTGESLAALVKLFGQMTAYSMVLTARLRWRRRETIDQMYAVAIQSLPIIAVSLFFITVMLITEFSFHVKMVLRQDSLVPAFSTILMIRELGPVVTSLLLASRVGAGIAAEIGSMKVTEQLDALRLLDISPVEYLTVPRWAGCVFGTVALSVTAIGIGILGGATVAALALGYNVQQYFQTMFLFTRFDDVTGCVIKAAVFGTVIPLTASHHGFRCRAGSQGVGEAATNAVVHSSILIIVADFVLTYLLYRV